MTMRDYVIESLFGGHCPYAVKINAPYDESKSCYKHWFVSSTATCFTTTCSCIRSKWFDSLDEAQTTIASFNEKHCIGLVGDDTCYYATAYRIPTYKLIWWWLTSQENDVFAADEKDNSH